MASRSAAVPVAAPDAPGGVRSGALRRLPFTAALVVGGLALFEWLYPRYVGPGVVFIPAVLIVPALRDLLELISGVPVKDVARRWNSLHGWQRGVLGTAIVLLCFVLLFGGLAAAAKLGLLG